MVRGGQAVGAQPDGGPFGRPYNGRTTPAGSGVRARPGGGGRGAAAADGRRGGATDGLSVGGASPLFPDAFNGFSSGGVGRPPRTTVAPVVNDVPPPVALSTVLHSADDQPLVGDVDVSRDVFYLQPLPTVPPSKRPRPPPPGAWTQPTRDILGPDSQHPYVQRWARMTQMEGKGEVKFRVIVNDGSRTALVNLLALKNLFIKQLPNMPRAYVTRLVFDRKHESLAAMKDAFSNPGTGFEAADGDAVMGGCCYRPFKEQRFAEVAFLAIAQTGQERGYGMRLMAHVKERAKRCGLTHLLTCADNNAVPYFKKQGFSKKITLPFELWQGRIKDYEGVLLMECKLHAQVDYLNVPLLLKAQKCALVEKLKEVSLSHVVYPGLDETLMRSGLPIEALPGLADISWRKDGRGGAALSTRGGAASGVTSRDPAAQAALKQHLQSVLDQLKAHKSAWPFLEPVNTEATGAVDYYTVIKDPIDLSTIQSLLNEGCRYVTKNIFLADLRRMVENCRTYNGRAHNVTEMAGHLERVFLSKL